MVMNAINSLTTYTLPGHIITIRCIYHLDLDSITISGHRDSTPFRRSRFFPVWNYRKSNSWFVPTTCSKFLPFPLLHSHLNHSLHHWVIPLPPSHHWVTPLPPSPHWVTPLPPSHHWVTPLPPSHHWVTPLPPSHHWVTPLPSP